MRYWQVDSAPTTYCVEHVSVWRQRCYFTKTSIYDVSDDLSEKWMGIAYITLHYTHARTAAECDRHTIHTEHGTAHMAVQQCVRSEMVQ